MTFKKYSTAMLVALLAALVLAVYWQTVGFEFINLDDLEYTVQNPIVRDGLTFSTIRESFTSIQLHTYMPLTLLSYMTDVEFFGLKPSGFHFTNTIIHLLNTLLLFAFLYRTTGSVWKSFFAAALWAIHPLRAESVAWVAERKDVLAGFFFLAGLLAYCEYAKSKRPVFYAATLIAMLLGLLSKSIVVVFPVVLLILDFWPLERLERQGETVKKLLIEKIPFFALSMLFSALTLINQEKVISPFESMSASSRLADVSTSYIHYLTETVWPIQLTIVGRISAAHLTGIWALGAGLLIIALTFLAWKLRNTAPAVTAGWFWYLAVLFPVSGVVPVAIFFVADHFTYLPHIGLMVALVWGVERFCGNFTKDMRLLKVIGAVVVLAVAAFCFSQVSLWKNSFTLFTYADNATGGKNALAKKNLGIAYYNAGEYQEAYDLYSQALLLAPSVYRGYRLKGYAAEKLGRFKEAAELYRMELKTSPGDRVLSILIANNLLQAGDLLGAARQGLENIRRWPDDAAAWDAVNLLGGETKAREIAGR